MKWRVPSDKFRTKNVFLYSNSVGVLTCRHLNTGKSIFKTKIDSKGDSQINCFEMSKDGETIGVVGADPTVFLLDTET